MSEETPQETPAKEPVAPASETPKQEAPPEYVSKSDYKAGLEAMEENIVSRLKQSTGDKVKAVVASEVEKLSGLDEAIDALRPLLKDGVSDEDIALVRERKYVQDLMSGKPSPEAVPEPVSPPEEKAPEPASSPPAFEAEIQTILETHGVKGDEPELLEYAEKNKGKPWYQIGQGFEDLAKSVAARSAGTSAGVVASQGQVATSDLVADFRKELAEGMKQGQKGMRYLRQLQQKYVEKGASIEDLDISPKGSVKTREYLYAKDGPR